MADLGEIFDDAAPEGTGEFRVLPEGDYMLRVSESDYQPNKAGTGHNIILTYEVMDGPDSGTTFRQWYSYQNGNETAQRIARESLAKLRNAIGLPSFRRTEELHDKPFIGTVKQRPGQGSYGPSNEVRTYKARPSVAARPAPAAVNNTRAVPPLKPSGAARPWDNAAA